MGRPSLAPGRYFRLLLVGYFEGLDSERGIAWRAADSLAVKTDSLVSKGGYFRGNVVKINEEPAATLRSLYLIDEKLTEQIGPR
jgi:Transposase domain (DUF772)